MKLTSIQRRFLLAAALVSLAILASFATLTIAKYVLDSREEDLGIAKGEDFVFQADLAENTEQTPYSVYDGEINFTLKSYNALISTPSPITYTVSVSGGAGAVKVDGADYSASQTLTQGTDAEDLVSISGLSDGLYTVTVASTAPYTKTLVLYFMVERTESHSYYTVTNHGDWCELDIYTGADNGDITVDYTGAPDNTDSRMTAWVTDGEGTLTGLAQYAHYKLVFFHASEFTLTQSGQPITEQGGINSLEGE